MSASPQQQRRPRRIAADEAHAWARNLRLGNPYAKLILSMLTIYVNGEGSCFVGIDQLAEDTELSADTVRKRLAWLEQVGAVARFPQWIDASGRRNGEGKGKRTSDDIRLLIEADADAIEARAAGESVPETAAAEAEISPRCQPGLNPGEDSVSPLVALGQPSDSSKGQDSSNQEPEPEESPQTPLAGGDGADDSEFEKFRTVYPIPVIDLPKARTFWSALSASERDNATRGAEGYARFVRAEKRRALDAHKWLRDRKWEGFIGAGAPAAARPRVFVIEGSPGWRSWLVFNRCIGKTSPPATRDGGGAMGWWFPSEHPPPGPVWREPSDGQWIAVAKGTQQWFAWQERLREAGASGSPSRQMTINGKVDEGWSFPSEWPAAKGTMAEAVSERTGC